MTQKRKAFVEMKRKKYKNLYKETLKKYEDLQRSVGQFNGDMTDEELFKHHLSVAHHNHNKTIEYARKTGKKFDLLVFNLMNIHAFTYSDLDKMIELQAKNIEEAKKKKAKKKTTKKTATKKSTKKATKKTTKKKEDK